MMSDDSSEFQKSVKSSKNTERKSNRKTVAKSTKNKKSAAKTAISRSSSPRTAKTKKIISPRSPRSRSPRKATTKDPSGLEITTDEEEVLSNLPKYEIPDEENIITVPKSGTLAKSRSPRKSAASSSQRTNSSPRSANKVKVPLPPGSKKLAKKKNISDSEKGKTGEKVDIFLTEKVGKPIGEKFTEISDKIKARNSEAGIESRAIEEEVSEINISKETDKALTAFGGSIVNIIPKEKAGNKDGDVLEGLRSFVKENKETQEIPKFRTRKFLDEENESPRSRQGTRGSREFEETIKESEEESPRPRKTRTENNRDKESEDEDLKLDSRIRNGILTSKESAERKEERKSSNKRNKEQELDTKIKDALLPDFLERALDTDNLLELTWTNPWAIRAVDIIYSHIGDLPTKIIREEGGYVSWQNIKGFDEVRVSDKLAVHLYPTPHLDIVTGFYSKPLKLDKDIEHNLSDDIHHDNDILVISTSSWARLISILSTLITISNKPISLFKAFRILESRVEEANNSEEILGILEDYVENN
jgi:hypothetical protein